jgi:hypothetical protein
VQCLNQSCHCVPCSTVLLHTVSFNCWNVSETQQLSTSYHCYSKLTSSHFILFAVTILSLSLTHTQRKEKGTNTDRDHFWLWQYFHTDDICVYRCFQTSPKPKKKKERERVLRLNLNTPSTTTMYISSSQARISHVCTQNSETCYMFCTNIP